MVLNMVVAGGTNNLECINQIPQQFGSLLFLTTTTTAELRVVHYLFLVVLATGETEEITWRPIPVWRLVSFIIGARLVNR